MFTAFIDLAGYCHLCALCEIKRGGQMTAGRKRIPTALKLVTGQADKRRMNENEPVFPEGQPEPPAFLRDEALVEWQE